MLLLRNRRVSSGLFGSITRMFSTEVAPVPPPAPPSAPSSPPSQKGEALYRRLTSLGRDKGSVKNTINKYIEEGRTIKQSELLPCIRGLRKFKKYKHALQIIEWMEENLSDFGFGNHALRLELITKAKGIDSAENYFNSLPPSAKNKSTYGALLFCYCEMKMEDKALNLFATMDELNLITDALPFRNLMTMYMKTRQPEKVQPLMEEMKKRNIEPNLHTNNLLMHSYSRLDDVEAGERVFEEMKQENKEQCNWTTYSNLAILYIRNGHKEKAELVLGELEKEMHPTNREGYHFLISLYGKISNLQKIHLIWKSLKANIKEMTNDSYLIMLQALRNLKDIDGMKKCYEECPVFDIRLANTVIGACLTNDKPDEAELVFLDAVNRSDGPFFKAYELFIKFYLENNQIKEALRYMEDSTSKTGYEKWLKKTDVVKRFLRYFREHGGVSSAKEFYRLMKRINCVDSYVNDSLREICATAGQELDG